MVLVVLVVLEYLEYLVVLGDLERLELQLFLYLAPPEDLGGLEYLVSLEDR